MRIICPNCGAQYAVDDRVIPEAGRDVQCSNCGNTWFQVHPDHDPDLAAELGYGLPGTLTGERAGKASGSAPGRGSPMGAPRVPERVPDLHAAPAPAATVDPAPEPAPASEPAFDDTPEPPAAPEPEPEPDFARASDMAAEDRPAAEAEKVPVDWLDSVAEEPSAAVPEEWTEPVREDWSDWPEAALYRDLDAALGEAPPPDDAAEPETREQARFVSSRRAVDEEAMSVLREEAAREQAARRAEAGALETQPELDIPPPDAPERAPQPEIATRQPARVSPVDTLPPEVDRAERPAPRRSLLPDVEEINDSLRPDETATAGTIAADLRERRTRGRRIGMGLAFLVFGALTLVYIQASRVSEAVPQATPTLERYVAAVDSGRDWLDRTLRDAVGTAQGTDG